LSVLLDSARRSRWKIRAVGSPFHRRDVLKQRGYRWEGGNQRRPGAWCAEVAESTFEAECEFLRAEIYRRSDAVIDTRLLSALDRYSARA
jgi:DNA polymerase-3 subunit epsilon